MRTTSSIRVIRDNDDERYRVVSLGDESDPAAAALARAKERFAENVRIATRGTVLLASDEIRVAHIPASEQQAAAFLEDMGPLPAEAEGAELKMTLPYALVGSTCFIQMEAMGGLEPDQIRTFFDEDLFPWFAERKLDAGTVEPVFIPNRLP